GRLIWVRLLSSAARPVLWILRDELLGNPPPPAQVLPSTSSLTWRPGGSLASSHQAWSTWSPDSVLGVISSGIRCARTFCEHLTALYAVECSKNTFVPLRCAPGGCSSPLDPPYRAGPGSYSSAVTSRSSPHSVF